MDPRNTKKKGVLARYDISASSSSVWHIVTIIIYVAHDPPWLCTVRFNMKNTHSSLF